MRFFPGSLPYNVADAGLRRTSETPGLTASVTIVKDPESEWTTDFGIVEMPDPIEARPPSWP